MLVFYSSLPPLLLPSSTYFYSIFPLFSWPLLPCLPFMFGPGLPPNPFVVKIIVRTLVVVHSEDHVIPTRYSCLLLISSDANSLSFCDIECNLLFCFLKKKWEIPGRHKKKKKTAGKWNKCHRILTRWQEQRRDSCELANNI